MILSIRHGQATLRPISPDDGQPGPVVRLSVSGSFPDCPEAPYDMIASAGKLIIYPQFGGKADNDCKGPGGFAIVDPTTGLVADRFDSNRFSQMMASSDGRYLYGLEVGSPAWRRVQIVKMDAAGRVIERRTLDPDVWYLAEGRIPQQMLGHMDLSASPPKP
jgi:hypothetical protein